MAGRLVITALSCSLVGRERRVTLRPGTRAGDLYGAGEAVERYYCNYGVNAEYVDRLEKGGLTLSGVGENGEVRIVELPDHPFYVATLFLPQARSSPASPHPVLSGYAAAVRDTADRRSRRAGADGGQARRPVS